MVDLSQVRVGVDRGTVAREILSRWRVFAKQNFYLLRAELRSGGDCHSGISARFNFDGSVRSASDEFRGAPPNLMWETCRARGLGWEGKYIGARGELTSTRNTDGSYKQVVTLLR